MDKITGTVKLANVNGTAQIMFKKRSDFPASGRASAEYVATDENKIYRYDKAAGKYVCIGTNPDDLQKQIDNIVIAGTGSGDAAAEVAQARVNADGVTSETLKGRLDAMDATTGNVKTMIYNRNHGTLSFKENVVFDPSTFTIKFPVGYMRYRANTYNNISAQTLDLTKYETSYNAWDLFFSIKNQNIYARNWQSITETQDVYIGSVYNNHIYINGVSDKYITVKGVDDKPTTTKIAYLTITGKVVYDVASKKLTIPAGYIKYNTNTYWAYSGQTIIFPYSDSDAWNIYYSLTNSNIYVAAWNTLITNGDPYLGAIYNDNININGVSFDNVTIKKKSVYFFGDSITGGTHSTAPYHYLMSSAICIKGLNYGIGGTGFVNTVTGTFITGNGVEGVGADVQQNGNNTIKEVMESVGDFSYCSIFAGTNDFGSNVPLDTFRTAVENTLDYALSVTPYVAVSTPIKRTQTTNNIGKTLEEYVEIIKNCCEERGIICFDAYNESGLNPANSVNRATFYTDGLHLSDKGHLRFARFYREYILKITG